MREKSQDCIKKSMIWLKQLSKKVCTFIHEYFSNRILEESNLENTFYFTCASFYHRKNSISQKGLISKFVLSSRFGITKYKWKFENNFIKVLCLWIILRNEYWFGNLIMLPIQNIDTVETDSREYNFKYSTLSLLPVQFSICHNFFRVRRIALFIECNNST